MRCDPRIDVHQAEQKQRSGLSRKSIHHPVHRRGCLRSFTFQPFGSDQGRRWLEIPGWKPSRRKRGTVLTHRSGEWPKNITIRILLSVKILVEFGPQCPGSIHYSVCGEKAYLADWVAGKRGGCSMSSWDEEMFTMMSGLAAVAVFCIAALLWLV